MKTPGGEVLVKICGVTTAADARRAVELGADYLGLNFHPPSPRFLSLDRAREIAREVAGRAPLVGVFVNRPAAEIEEIAAAVPLDLLQFHGDEGPAEVAAFGSRAIKVFRRGGRPRAAEIDAYPDAGGFLFDAPHDTLYGGTGAGWSWGEALGLPELPELAAGRPVFLAGGVGPDNLRRVLAAAASSGAAAKLSLGVDVCSGVESAPGIKSHDLFERLFAEMRDGQSPSST